MGISTSIAGIYYQIQDEWQNVSSQTDWRLALWIVPYGNVAIIDKFLEIERSPVGRFNDVFFRFETEYKGKNDLFLKELWNEYCSWFMEELPDKYNILKALKEEGVMKGEYILPDIQEPENYCFLWNEFLKFKSCIKGMENRDFCIYFPPSLPDGLMLTGCFRSILKEGIPEGVRLVTIDYVENRKVKLPSGDQIIYLKPEFDLNTAINNEMDKECDTYDSPSFDSRYRKQIRKVMDITLQKNESVLDKEIEVLLSIAKETTERSVHLATPLIVSQAYFSIGSIDKCMDYAEKAIQLSEDAISKGDINGYSIWKVSMFQKAAIYIFEKKREAAILIYQQIAEEATERQDAFYIMESYRMCGLLMYETGKTEDAFESFLLSLAGGSYLDMKVRRRSTFIYSAYLALLLGKKVRSPQEMHLLKEQLQLWLGDDWSSLVNSSYMEKAKNRHKSSIFS